MGHGLDPVDSCGQVGDLDPSLVNTRNLSRVGQVRPVDGSEISTRPGQNDKPKRGPSFLTPAGGCLSVSDQQCSAVKIVIRAFNRVELYVCLSSVRPLLYRGGNKGLYVVARNFFLLLLNCSAWPCLGPA